jgi:pyridoxal phosphate enzyme (YggS family)
MNEFLAANLQAVQQSILESATLANRNPNDITLLAVSKTVGVSNIEKMARLGQINFAENYAQEGLEKILTLKEREVKGLIWHFIGPLQSNKTRLVAENFDWVQTVDRLKIAQRLSEQRPTHLHPIQLCIQVNIDGGTTKSGVNPLETLELARAIRKLPHTTLRGLMTIPDPVDGAQAQREIHNKAKLLFDSIKVELQSEEFDTLSMGMSMDMKEAIAAGSTMVRVGTALFGSRKTGTQ